MTDNISLATAFAIQRPLKRGREQYAGHQAERGSRLDNRNAGMVGPLQRSYLSMRCAT